MVERLSRLSPLRPVVYCRVTNRPVQRQSKARFAFSVPEGVEMTTPVVHEIRPVVRTNGTPPITRPTKREHELELKAVVEDCYPQEPRSES